MTTIAISCPKCEKQIKAPAELAGKKIRCKECMHVFIVKAAGGKPAGKGDKPGKGGKDKADKKPAPAKKGSAEADDDANPYGVTDHEFLPRCAYCAKEMEEEGQVVCLNCGYNHSTRERIAVEKTLEPTAGEWIIHLLPGVICALVVLLILGGMVFEWIDRPAKEAAYSEMTVNPYTLGLVIWRSVIGLFICFFCGKFAIKRLILHTRPPERAMQVKKK